MAGHDIYAINDFTIPAQGQVPAETGIAIGLPKSTYARIAPRSGLASKKEIAINGGVIDADYTGEVKVIMVNYGKNDCRIQPGDPIAQLIIEKIDISNMMEVNDLEVTELADGGFGGTDISPKGTTPVTDCKPMIGFPQANYKDNEYFDAEDMGRYLRLLKEHTILMSNTIITQVERRDLDTDFITKVLAASDDDQEWQERRAEWEKLENEGKEFPKNWQSND